MFIFSGGDLKFIANVMGINQANSKHPCPLCIWQKPESHVLKFDKRAWSIADQNLGARKQTQAENLHNDKNTNLGYIKLPIIKYIEFENVTVDLLHCCLRISDKMQEHLLDDIESLDARVQKYSKKMLDSMPNLNNYVMFLKTECNIKMPCYINAKEEICINGNLFFIICMA